MSSSENKITKRKNSFVKFTKITGKNTSKTREKAKLKSFRTKSER